MRVGGSVRVCVCVCVCVYVFRLFFTLSSFLIYTVVLIFPCHFFFFAHCGTSNVHGQADKVQYMQQVKEIPSPEGRAASLALFCHQVNKSEVLF